MLRLAPWLRAPLLLLARPGVALALLAAAFVATLPAAAAPLFLSSARNAALEPPDRAGLPVDRRRPRHRRARVDYPLPPASPRRDAITDLVAYRKDEDREPGPGRADARRSTAMWLTADAVRRRQGSRPGQRHDPRRLRRARAAARSGGTGPGVWLPDRFAGDAGLTVGDQITIDRARRRRHDAGQRIEPTDDHRAGRRDLPDLRAGAAGPVLVRAPAPVRGRTGPGVQQPPDRAAGARRRADLDRATCWPSASRTTRTPTSPSPTRTWTSPSATTLAAGLSRMRTELRGRPAHRVQPAGHDAAAGLRAAHEPGPHQPRPAGAVDHRGRRRAWACWWSRRPGCSGCSGAARELTVLAAHGVGPVALGYKALLEALPALVLGAAAAGVRRAAAGALGRAERRRHARRRSALARWPPPRRWWPR